MAGEIYIADKVTLDAVNTKVGTASDTGGTTSAGTLMAKMNKNISDTANLAGVMTSTRGGYIDNINSKVNAMAANNERKGFTAADLITNKKFVLNTVNLPTGSTMQTLLNISGSGYLYLAVASYSGDEYNTKTIDFTVTVDGIVICNKSIVNPYNDASIGVISNGALMRNDDGSILNPYSDIRFRITTSSMEAPSSVNSKNASIIYLPKPVRFVNSLKLNGKVSGSDPQYCSFMYELD